MDEIVKQAMAKWPNVPHCYGWLALDARGAWRMRDERAQALNLPGDRIVHPALLNFINRNYTHDDQGRWYFQNGPQRVYVNLEATPYIVHTDSEHNFVTHTGELLSAINAAWMTGSGKLILQRGEKIALVDDRDMAHCLTQLRMDGKPVSDEQLLAWLSNPDTLTQLSLNHHATQVNVLPIRDDMLADEFGFISTPQPD